MNDILDDNDIAQLTGVKPKAQRRTEKVVSILTEAGIYHWLDHRCHVVTTWHHVHSAGQSVQSPQETVKLPRFDRA